MGKVTGFLEIERRERPYEDRHTRVKTWREFVRPLPTREVERQAGRCMSCGIPFCHTGCPVNNLIPDWNDLVWRPSSRGRPRLLPSPHHLPPPPTPLLPPPHR